MPLTAARLVLVLTLSASSFQAATARTVPGREDAPAAAQRSVQVQSCPTVARAFFDDPAMVPRLASWTEPWEVNRQAGWVLVGVDVAGIERLRAAGFRVEIDVELTERLCAPRIVPKEQTAGIPTFPCYRTVEETFDAARSLVQRRGDLATWVDIGNSWEKTQTPTYGDGDDLMVLKLTNRQTAGTGTPADPGSKPVLFVMGGIHARELAPPELLLRFAELLVDGHGVDADATWLLDEHEIHLLLLANPDGRHRAETLILWRKNADNDYCTNTDQRGADLNRNFEFGWACCNGSSHDPCDQLYRGSLAASEPETMAIQEYLRSVFPSQWQPEPPANATGIFLDIHSYGRLILWPWGANPDPSPNGTALATLGRKMAYHNNHTPEQGVDFYPADGTTLDFAYGDLGVAAYAFELGTWFFEECQRFEDEILDGNLGALTYAAKVARSPYTTPSGPEVVEIAFASGDTVAEGQGLDVTASVSDLLFRLTPGAPPEPTHAVVAVTYTIDVPPWREGAPLSTHMLPSDGVLDSTIELAEAAIDTSGLAPGRHTLFVRALDANGAWGAVSAAFFWVERTTPPPRRPSRRAAP